MDTTRFDGAECRGCGEPASHPVRVVGGFADVPLCRDCRDQLTTKCPECERTIWQKDGARIGSELFCEVCYAKHPVICGATMAEIRADEQQDDFNRSRR